MDYWRCLSPHSLLTNTHPSMCSMIMTRAKLKHALFLSLCLLLLPATLSAKLFNDEWDRDFQDAVEVFLPVGYDWRMLKAQCYQESLLNPLAQSHVGARGICQFMDGTFSSVVSAGIAKHPSDVWMPEISIRASAWYMAKLHRTWKAPRPPMDRAMLSMASYNAGAGHLIKSQRLCGSSNLYRQIIPCLHQVTGHHSNETKTYVERIVGKWYPMMLFE